VSRDVFLVHSKNTVLSRNIFAEADKTTKFLNHICGLLVEIFEYRTLE
jgi:hypothetical protein